MLYAIIFAIFAQTSESDLSDCNKKIVYDFVDTISVAHCPDDKNFIFFWDVIQNQWEYVDCKWFDNPSKGNISFSKEKNKWILFYEDTDCFRLIEANAYIESWENYNVRSEFDNVQVKPWFARLCNRGLTNP